MNGYRVYPKIFWAYQKEYQYNPCPKPFRNAMDNKLEPVFAVVFIASVFRIHLHVWRIEIRPRSGKFDEEIVISEVSKECSYLINMQWIYQLFFLTRWQELLQIFHSSSASF